MPARSAQEPFSSRQVTAEAAGELEAQLGLVEVAGRAQLQVQPAPVQGRPAALRAPAQVGDEHVAVQVGVRSPARAVKEGGGGEAGGGNRRGGSTCSRAPAHPGPAPLQIAEGGHHRLLVARADLGPNLLGPEGVQQAHRLRRRVRAVVGDDADPGAVLGEQLARRRVDTGQKRLERGRLHGPRQSERRRRPPQPASVRLYEAVVALAPGGQSRKVVVLASPGELGDAEHAHWLGAGPTTPPTGPAPPLWVSPRRGGARPWSSRRSPPAPRAPCRAPAWPSSCRPDCAHDRRR